MTSSPPPSSGLHSIIREDLEGLLACDLPWQRLDGIEITITGGAGFLAAYLAESLLHLADARGKGPSRVVLLARDSQRARDRWAHRSGHPRLELVVGDVSDPWPEALPGQLVIHAASVATPAAYAKDPTGVLRANTEGTWHALERARRDRGRALFFSSSEVYGNAGADGLPLSEQTPGPVDPFQLRACYAEGKRAGESLCFAHAHQFGTPVQVIRPFHTYGPGMRLDDGRVFADFAADALAGRDIVMKSDGAAVRAYTYLSDFAHAIYRVLLRGEDRTAYNIANDEAVVSVAELAEIVARCDPGHPVRVVRQERKDGYLPSPFSRIVPDVSRLRALGWKPLINLETGFLRTLRSYR